MEKLSPVEAYVPVNCSDELPPKETSCYFTMLKQEGQSTIMGSHLYNFNGKEGWDEEDEYVPPNYWLKHLLSHYLFSKEEIERLIGEAFDVGKNSENAFLASKGATVSKKEYLKSLGL